MNNPTEKSLEAELLCCPFCSEDGMLKVHMDIFAAQCSECDCELTSGHTSKLGAIKAWNTRKGEAARLKAMTDKPEVVDRVALVMGRVIAQAEVQPVKAWEKAAKAVLAELVKMMEGMIMPTLEMFPETKPPRQPRHVLMHVTDAGMGDGLKHPQHLAEFTCNTCGYVSGWMVVDSVSEAKRGVPCPECNTSEQQPAAKEE